jgi:hypothetical protein
MKPMLHDIQAAGRRLTLRNKDEKIVKITSAVEFSQWLGAKNITQVSQLVNLHMFIPKCVNNFMINSM